MSQKNYKILYNVYMTGVDGKSYKNLSAASVEIVANWLGINDAEMQTFFNNLNAVYYESPGIEVYKNAHPVTMTENSLADQVLSHYPPAAYFRHIAARQSLPIQTN